jgi:hypothetical protein
VETTGGAAGATDGEHGWAVERQGSGDAVESPEANNKQRRAWDGSGGLLGLEIDLSRAEPL